MKKNKIYDFEFPIIIIVTLIVFFLLTSSLFPFTASSQLTRFAKKPQITLNEKVLITDHATLNYVNGTVVCSEPQIVFAEDVSGNIVSSEIIPDAGINKSFALVLPKLNKGTTKFNIKTTALKSPSEDYDSQTLRITYTPKANNEILKTPKGMNPRLNKLVQELCWPNGTNKSKYSKSSGNPKEAYVKAAQKYLGSEVREIKRGSRDAMTDCSYFVATLIRASGVDPKFRALRFDYADKNKDWKYVSKGKKVDSSILMAGDVIQYKKKGGGNHVIIYLGNNTYAQASRHGQFPRVFKQNRKGHEMYNAQKVRTETLQVIRNEKLAEEMYQEDI